MELASQPLLSMGIVIFSLVALKVGIIHVLRNYGVLWERRSSRSDPSLLTGSVFELCLVSVTIRGICVGKELN